MKIGVITINDNNNFGNRLQNYAMVCALEKLSFECENIKNDAFSNTKKMFVLRILKHLFSKSTYSDNLKKANNFYEFNKNINTTKKKVHAFSHLPKYDFVITGSDQVWNPNFGRLRDVDLLTFVDSEKRISYAASFGVNEIPENLKENISKELKKFKAISVREDRGKEIVEELTGRKDVEVLIDPTMLLTSEEWDKVSKKPTMLKTDKYILNYFLGELSEERKNEIERIAKENNCEIINILDKNSPFYECGPSEFLYLEKNAFLICTDSFHSSVFAILYNRPFIIFDREQKNLVSMNSRLETLIKKFKLKDRKFEGKITDKNLQHDYTEAYKILEEERKKSDKFLKKALDIKE